MLSATAFLYAVAIAVHVLSSALRVPMKGGALSYTVLRMLSARLAGIRRVLRSVMAAHTAGSRRRSGIRQRQTQQRQQETKEVSHFFSFAQRNGKGKLAFLSRKGGYCLGGTKRS